MIQLIGLNGSMGSGKSTAVEVLRGTLKPFQGVRLVKFAQPLYDMQEFAYNRIASVYSRPESFTKDRKLLQWLGTDWGRDTISKTLWVDIWKTAAEAALDDGYLVVCDDVRFDNEAEVIRSLGGKIVQITSTRTAERIDTKSGIAGHKSESGISPSLIDATVENNSTLDEYKNLLHTTFKLVTA